MPFERLKSIGYLKRMQQRIKEEEHLQQLAMATQINTPESNYSNQALSLGISI